MLKGFENKDPPRVKKLAVHTNLPDWICKLVHRKGILPQYQAVGDLKMITFYYLLRVGGYTAQKRWGRQPITQQFLVNDVTFFKLSKTCGFLSPLPLMQANRSCCQRCWQNYVSTNRETRSRVRVCTMDHWKDKYLHVQ